MRTLARATAAMVALALGTTAADAQIRIVTNMTPGAETTPPQFTTEVGAGVPRPVSFGFATFTLNASQTELTMMATAFDIDFGGQTPYTTDDLLAAHIHAGPTAVLGSNAGVVWGFYGAPFHDAESTPFANCTGFATGVGGTCRATWNLLEGNNTTLTAQLPNLLGGLAYVNFHTVQNPGGEIRGQLAVVPEPATVLLLGTGLAGLGLITMRRRRGDA